jgi:hypothetical protein
MLKETARLPLDAELTTQDMMHLRKSVPKTGTGATKYEEISSRYLYSLVDTQWKKVWDVHLLNRLDSDANLATTEPAVIGSSRRAVRTLSTTAPAGGREGMGRRNRRRRSKRRRGQIRRSFHLLHVRMMTKTSNKLSFAR